MQKKSIAIVLILYLIFLYLFPILTVQAGTGSISYKVHLKDLGWRKAAFDGETAGTTGECRRMEAIKINLLGVDGELTYKVHVEKYGWLKSVSEGELAGTTGECKRMEAIIINLDNSSYNIKYRVHVRDKGWMKWVNNGEVAGTTGECRRIEAIEIIVEKKEIVEDSFNNVENNELENLLIDDNNNHQENNNAEIIDDNNQQENNNTEIINDNNNETSQENNNIYSGIDVSKYQGTIDWAKVKNSGINFAMIRCGYRGLTIGSINEDEKFSQNVINAPANGIKIGLYFYSSAINEEEAVEEANYVLNLIDKYNAKSNITYPVAIDIEDFEGTRNYNLTVEERTNIVKVFCEKIKDSGFEPMVYSYTYFLENKLNMNELESYDTWIADYYGNTWYNRKYTIWQYTDKGLVDGIIGNVDMNYSYKNY